MNKVLTSVTVKCFFLLLSGADICQEIPEIMCLKELS